MPERQASYRFGEFQLDPNTARLSRAGRELELSPRAFQVLAYLIENRSRVVSKQELVEAVWKDTFVTDDALVQAISTIRHALADSADNSRYIRTRPRVGYQFIAPVQTDAEGGQATAAAPVSIWVAPIGRQAARRLMVAIQLGYLGLYSFTLFHLDIASSALVRTLLEPIHLTRMALPSLLILALVGVAVRLYLLAAVALDHPATGRQFARLRPALFVLDLLWALTPLLLEEETGLPLALALIPVLVYAPFSQSTLVRSAYATGQAAPPA